MITRLTALLIKNSDQVYCIPVGPENGLQHGKYAFFIGMLEPNARNDGQRVRSLLSSEPVYDTADAAKTAGFNIISSIKAKDESELLQ